MAETIEHLHQEVLAIKKAMLQMQQQLKDLAQHAVHEDDESHLELADDLVAAIEDSRRSDHWIPHEQVVREFRRKHGKN